MSDGESKSSEPDKTAEGQMQRIDAVLAAYEQGLGLRPPTAVPEADRFLNLSSSELKNLTKEECAEGYYTLQQYALFIQRELNKEIGHVTWATDKLNLYIVREAEGHRGKNYSSFEERKLLAISESEYGTKLYRLKTACQVRVDRLNFVASSIFKIAQALLEVRNGKQN